MSAEAIAVAFQAGVGLAPDCYRPAVGRRHYIVVIPDIAAYSVGEQTALCIAQSFAPVSRWTV